MEYQILVDGEPVTAWERVRAADVGLWKSTFQTSDNTVTHRSRPIHSADEADTFTERPSLDLSKAELLRMADAKGLDVPSGSTKAQLVDLLN